MRGSSRIRDTFYRLCFIGTVHFTYKRKKINEIEANFTYSEGYDGININFLIDEINQVDDVKDKIPSDLLYEMNMD